MAASTPYMPTSFHTKPQLPPVPVISTSRAQPHCSSSSFREENSPHVSTHTDSSRVMNEAEAAHTPIVFMAMCCCPALQRSLSRKNVEEKKKKNPQTQQTSPVWVLIKSFCGYLVNYICCNQRLDVDKGTFLFESPLLFWAALSWGFSLHIFKLFTISSCKPNFLKVDPQIYIKTMFCAPDFVWNTEGGKKGSRGVSIRRVWSDKEKKEPRTDTELN